MKAQTVVSDSGRRLKRRVSDSEICGKKSYSTKKLAKTAAARQRKATGEPIHAYHCARGCHCWHIGHPPGTKQRSA